MSNTSTQIKAYGRFFRKNNQGEFLNDCDFHNLSSPWYELVKAWQKGCLNLFSSNLISLYLRGSIPRGLAIENCSDLDGIVVVKPNFYQENNSNLHLDKFHQQLQSQFTFCRGIETQIITEEDIFNPLTGWGIILKMQGLCVEGADYNTRLPAVSMGLHLVNHSFSLAEDINLVCQWIKDVNWQQKKTFNLLENKCSWLSKRIIRSGFELVMSKENCYTRDLYLNYTVFAKYFPERERDMQRALFLAINPSHNPQGLMVFWREFGGWLTAQIETYLEVDEKLS